MIDLQDPQDELVAAGVSQLAFVAVTLVLVEFDLAPATPEFVAAAWVTSAVWSTVAYFLASDYLANQRSEAVDSEALVSDERGQLTAGPVTAVAGAVALLIAGIVFLQFATSEELEDAEVVCNGFWGCGPPPIEATVLAVGFTALLLAGVAVSYWRGGRGE